MLNEKFRPRHRIDRRGVDDDDGGRAAGAARNGRPAASLPRRIREATLQSSFDASSLTPAMMMMGAADDDETADNDDSASCPPPCMEMIYHTRFVMGGTVVALAATSDGSGKAGEDAVIDDDDLPRFLHRLRCQRFKASLQLPRAPVSRHYDRDGNGSVDGHFVVLLSSLAASRWVDTAARSAAASMHSGES